MANHHHLTRSVEEFMKLDRGLTLFQMYAFLLIATNEGQTQKWVEDKLKTSNATASRTVGKWLDYQWKGKPGLGMVESHPDPSDRRYTVLSLSPKGRDFLKRVRSKLGEDQDADPTS